MKNSSHVRNRILNQALQDLEVERALTAAREDSLQRQREYIQEKITVLSEALAETTKDDPQLQHYAGNVMKIRSGEIALPLRSASATFKFSEDPEEDSFSGADLYFLLANRAINAIYDLQSPDNFTERVSQARDFSAGHLDQHPVVVLGLALLGDTVFDSDDDMTLYSALQEAETSLTPHDRRTADVLAMITVDSLVCVIHGYSEELSNVGNPKS